MDIIPTTPAVALRGGQPVTTSLDVAERFGKQHKSVLRAIANLECSEGFGRRNFAPSDYLNEQNKPQPMYHITRDGFAFLAMGFTGRDAATWKEAYIEAFNRMEQALARTRDEVYGRNHEILNGFLYQVLKRHPSWPFIRQSLAKGEPVKRVAATHQVSPASVYYAARRMVALNLLVPIPPHPGATHHRGWRLPDRQVGWTWPVHGPARAGFRPISRNLRPAA